MKKIHLIFFDAGGGHRSATDALLRVIEQQKRPWHVEKINLQDLFDSFDILRKLTGVRSQDIYNNTLRRGWTLGSPQLTRVIHGIIRAFHRKQVQVLRDFWQENRADLVVSVVPNFNRAVLEALETAQPKTPFVTVLTDFADYPPHFWMEKQRQYLVCGTDRAMEQAQGMGHAEDRIFRASGMILHPKFYEQNVVDRRAARTQIGLDADTPTGLVLFGGYGSKDILTIVDRVSGFGGRLQLILICGHNQGLADRLRRGNSPVRLHVEGFTEHVPYFMQIADFFIGKPGPASISEALLMELPVIVERNAWTLPQERYNAQWVQEKGVGVVVSSFREIGAAIEQMLDPASYEQFLERVRNQRNRAVFEIPDFLEQILESAAPASDRL